MQSKTATNTITIMKQQNAKATTTGSTSNGQRRILFALLALVITQIIIGHDFSIVLARIDLTPLEYMAGHERNHKEDYPKELDVPNWSAFARQHHKNITELDALIEWRVPGKGKTVDSRRSATEVLTYGLSGVFPWYGTILPAIRFDLPFQKSTQVEIAFVEDLVDATLDIHQCSVGRDETNKRDGYYDVCFPPKASGRKVAKSQCYKKEGRAAKFRIHNYPSPGHERWSCHDMSIMEQLVGAQILDFLLAHGDRFFADRTNNLFFSWEQRPINFVSIDHHGSITSFYGKKNYTQRVRLKYLLEHEMPLQLRDEIKRVVLHGSKDKFVDKVNATIYGQLDNLNTIFADLYKELLPEKEQPKSITDIIWNRLESVVDFYNLTIDTIDTIDD